MDSGRRYCVRLRPELERLCRVSIHQLWILDDIASVLAIDDDVDDHCEHAGTGRELQIQFRSAAASGKRGSALSSRSYWGTCLGLQVAAA
jgi:hypothetical protein